MPGPNETLSNDTWLLHIEIDASKIKVVKSMAVRRPPHASILDFLPRGAAAEELGQARTRVMIMHYSAFPLGLDRARARPRCGRLRGLLRSRCV